MLLIVLGNTQRWTWYEFSRNGSLACQKIICCGSASLIEFQWFWNTRYARERLIWEGIFSRRKGESIIVCYENAKEDHIDNEILVEICCNRMQHPQEMQASVYRATSICILSKRELTFMLEDFITIKIFFFCDFHSIFYSFRLRIICTWWLITAAVVYY